jgi:hypothetical protein
MPADFISEPPADGLFEAAEAEPTTPRDGDFLSSLILIGDAAESSDSAQE